MTLSTEEGQQALKEIQRKEFKSPLDRFIEDYCSLCPRWEKGQEFHHKGFCSLNCPSGLDRMMLCVAILEARGTGGF